METFNLACLAIVMKCYLKGNISSAIRLLGATVQDIIMEIEMPFQKYTKRVGELF
jgi:hypothetical protein